MGLGFGVLWFLVWDMGWVPDIGMGMVELRELNGEEVSEGRGDICICIYIIHGRFRSRFGFRYLIDVIVVISPPHKKQPSNN